MKTSRVGSTLDIFIDLSGFSQKDASKVLFLCLIMPLFDPLFWGLGSVTQIVQNFTKNPEPKEPRSKPLLSELRKRLSFCVFSVKISHVFVERTYGPEVIRALPQSIKD